MGSMGMLLADWSIHIIKSRRQKGKQKKEKKERKEAEEFNKQDDVCGSCQRTHEEQRTKEDQLQQFINLKGLAEAEVRSLEAERERLKSILEEVMKVEVQRINQDGEDGLQQGQEEMKAENIDIFDAVQKIILQNQEAQLRVEEGREELTRLAEGVGRQLQDRDNAHADRVKSLEILMHEKEKQLLQSSNLLRQQLAAARRDLEQLQNREESLIHSNSFSDNNLEQEVASLRLVLEMRRVEVEQLRAANNSLLLEIERCRVQELQLQQHMQRVEEMEAVIRNKNQQIRKLCEDEETLTHQLEIEESAHLSCQQELERSQWALENFMTNNREKVTKNLMNMKESGLILDLVHK